ncbi:MAG: hypothetical protein ACLQU3_21005 [Limisphaerales bacterium]
MITNEKMEKYLEGIALPEYESDEHRRRLRSQILGQLATHYSGRPPRRIWRVAALVAGVLCAGALAAQVAVQVHRYFFEGRTADGSYKFATQPQTLRLPHATVVQSRSATMGSEELGAGGIEQMQSDLEEIDSLRQQDAGELMGVIDTEVNGYSPGRVFQFRYVLADGRTRFMNEGDSESRGNASAAQIEKDQEQIAELRQQGQREITTVIETEVGSQVDRTLICRYVLPDDREVIMGESDPAVGSSGTHLSAAQRDELMRLVGLKSGTFIGSIERQLFGRSFTFERYSYKLADGTVAIRAEGQPTGLKRNLTEADWSELANLTKAGAGELLGKYEQEIRGKLFSFEKKRYILSDGTEVVRSRGVPKADN